ncbi:dynamin family protein [Prosthecobacter sp.]
MSSNPINLKAIAETMARVAGLETDVTEKAIDDDFKSAITTTALGLFRVVVMGEIKKGKSSFINALCAQPGLVPVHSDVATSTVFKIRYGKEVRYTVFFQEKESNGHPAKKEITSSEIHDYGTESGNPDNIKKVDFIAVEAPSSILKDGLILVDTPGVGGLFKKHRDITYRYAPKADAIFFITDMDAPIGAEEVSFLRELRRTTGFVYFVQTKAASADAEARKKRMENNISILENEVGIPKNEIAYFVVDSKLKTEGDKSSDKSKDDLDDLKISGYPELASFIQRGLKPRKDHNIGTLAIQRSRLKTENIRAELEQRMQILDSDSEEKIKALDDEIELASHRLKEWETGKAMSLIQEFTLEMNNINSDTQTHLSLEIRPGGVISDFCNSALLNVAEKASANGIYASSQQLIEEVRARCSEMLLKSCEGLQAKSEKLLTALAEKAGDQLSHQFLFQANGKDLGRYVESSLRDIMDKSQHQNIYGWVTIAVGGGVTGGMIGGVIGASIGSMIPVVGTLVGGVIGKIIGGAWGASSAYKYKSDKERESARREVMAVIDKELSNILAVAIAELNKATFTLRTNAEEAIRKIINQTRDRFTRQRADLQKRRNADQKTLKEQKDRLEKQLKELAQISSRLDKQLKELAQISSQLDSYENDIK